MDKSINTLIVLFRGKKIVIDITKELKIDENTINEQLKESPSSYAFICTLRNNYIKLRDKLEREKDRVYSEVWLFYKEANQRYNNDTVGHLVNTNKKYQAILKEYLKAADKANRLISFCRAFERREDTLRTLSANLRKETF